MSQFKACIGKKSLPRRSAFSMIELVIVVVIIGIIAAIAIPRMSRGSAAAADSAVASNLAVLRNAIDLYHTEHQGTYPPVATFADQLTKYSNIDGTTTSATKDTATGVIYGPYLRAVPQISVGAKKGSSGVAAADAAGVAWIYDVSTGSVTANALGNDQAGKAYSAY
ncbi:prepilin-type N-terminal cleavage/methylation domain-containing protein [Humisphaera borealis]|uniref:Prepilin-type N-terminal cleavage/methylation domain-containing protein n=1 Tax=Humisphaera borealis TaxID=2807512 RepID=A0A7M2WPD9_9BACT|nr:prepilin-type N-terminal cleavage/methylation domain-containing protein [Humisphaera borealis]QOV87397.1 prepilin-type N-terminal cleavage/methylation domain-containing protein [Humisphaera borealis]